MSLPKEKVFIHVLKKIFKKKLFFTEKQNVIHVYIRQKFCFKHGCQHSAANFVHIKNKNMKKIVIDMHLLIFTYFILECKFLKN